MSRENVQVVREVIEALGQGRIGAALGAFAPTIVWRGTESLPGGKPRHGPQGVQDFYSSWLGVWEAYDVELERVIDAGNIVVSIGRERGVGRASGAGVHRGHFAVWEFRDRKIVSARFFDKESEAFQAAGLPEN